jgi:dCMP deaminase
MIINSGIKRVVYEGDYPDPLSLELFKLAGVEIVRITAK